MFSKRSAIAARLERVRFELYGEHGGPLLARELGIPFRTWSHYEAGVTIPGDLLLRFLAVTQVEPEWLLEGSGPQYRRSEGNDLNGQG